MTQRRAVYCFIVRVQSVERGKQCHFAEAVDEVERATHKLNSIYKVEYIPSKSDSCTCCLLF